MSKTTEILIAGESWVTHSIHQKGFDSFTTTSYQEGADWLRAALEEGGFEVEFMPNHLAPTRFPLSLGELEAYRMVMLSDIGTNTLLLHPDTFERSVPLANRLILLRNYVANGGGLVMVGGYMSFQGIEGRARYKDTPIEEVLPVTMLPADDRVEMPQGCRPTVVSPGHPIVVDLPREWPFLLGYNRVQAKPAATTIVEIDRDPLLAVWQYQHGRAVAFTSDCGPHWCPPKFTEWEGYSRLWQQIVRWTAGA